MNQELWWWASDLVRKNKHGAIEGRGNFDRSINPMSTRGSDYTQPDFQMFLLPCLCMNQELWWWASDLVRKNKHGAIEERGKTLCHFCYDDDDNNGAFFLSAHSCVWWLMVR